MICTVCPKGCHLNVDESFNVTGHECKRGVKYGKDELQNPVRVVTSTVRITGAIHRRLPVKTTAPIPKGLVNDAMQILEEIEVAAPVKIGDIIIGNICNTNVSFIASRSM